MLANLPDLTCALALHKTPPRPPSPLNGPHRRLPRPDSSTRLMKHPFKRLLQTLSGKRHRSDRRERKSGDAARDRADWATADRHYSKHLSCYPDDFAIWVQCGHVRKEARNYAGAREAYLTAHRLRPLDPDLMLCRGHLEKLDGRLDAAAKFYLQSYMQNGNRQAGAELASAEIFSRLDPIAAFEAGPFRITGFVEGLRGKVLFGWALLPDDPSPPPNVELSVDGVVIATARPTTVRNDLLRLGYPTRAVGFQIDLAGIVDFSGGANVEVRLHGLPLVGSPFLVEEPEPIRTWRTRNAGLSSDDIARLAAPFERSGDEAITLIMPIYKPRLDWLCAALDSILDQWCQRWLLICVDDGSADNATTDFLNQYAARDSRIRIITLEKNRGIAAATNIALRSANSEYVAFMDQDDVLEPEAIMRIIDATHTNATIIYSDEIVTGSDIEDIRFASCRPSFSHDYYLSHPYFVHLVCVKRREALGIGGLDENLSISGDVDFVLRMIEKSAAIAHIPALLYRWRTHATSVGHVEKDGVAVATSAAIERHLRRLGQTASVGANPSANAYVIDYIMPRTATLVTARPGFDPRDEPNGPDADYYLFLSDHVRLADTERMQALCSRSDVGVVGATVLAANGNIRQSGMVIGMHGLVGASHEGQPFRHDGRLSAGYNSSLISTRDYSAASTDCLMVSSRLFEAVGGFDPMLSGDLAMADMCLRIGALGYRVLNDGQTIAHCENPCPWKPEYNPDEAETFRKKWAGALANGDPFYNPALSLERDHTPSRLSNLTYPTRVWQIGALEDCS